MNTFIDENFLLHSEHARYLYHNHAVNQPIIDYHNHLDPEHVALDVNFDTITKAWLGCDHYKWRAMRANGVHEEYITGKSTSDFQKFEKWALTVPYTMRNPLYHWTHLELKRYFGINDLLCIDNARPVFDTCNEMLSTKEFSTLGLLQKMNVKVICTTDDPVDDLKHHQAHAASGHQIKMLPTFRVDKVLAVEDVPIFKTYIQQLESVSNTSITNLSLLMQTLERRHDFFATMGCKVSDHGLETMYAADFKEKDIEMYFQLLLRGVSLQPIQAVEYKSYILYQLALLDAQKGWVQQFHLGALRNNNFRLQKLLGADCGADSIGDFEIARSMSKFFNKLDQANKLAKTIIYNLNPAFNEVFATMAGNFQDGYVPGKIQFGSAWWFLDQKDGMEKQINCLSNMGLLSRFVGMLTDSRSFLSFPRHEYFRRILCNLIGEDIKNGYLPDDKPFLGKIIENICYHNAKNYFNFA